MQATSFSDQTRLQSAFDTCLRREARNINQMAGATEPRTWAFYKDGNCSRWNEGFFEIGNWTTSSFTGMALLAWRESEDDFFLQPVLRLAPPNGLKVLEQHLKTMHDFGFLYSLYSVALYKLTGDKAQRKVGLRPAELLAGPFIPAGGYSRAWGRMGDDKTEYAGLAIIDCPMNSPLLHRATAETGNHNYRDIAIRHADSTLKNFVRVDDSVFHAFCFDSNTGEPTGPDNYCRRAVESHGARGAAWAIYGLALSYAYTSDARYLDVSLRVAKKLLAGFDQEVVPVWDFKPPPGENRLRDSSAAAALVCGFQVLEMAGLIDDSLWKARQGLLARMCSDDYLDSDQTRSGGLRNAEADDVVGEARNACTSWGTTFSWRHWPGRSPNSAGIKIYSGLAACQV